MAAGARRVRRACMVHAGLVGDMASILLRRGRRRWNVLHEHKEWLCCVALLTACVDAVLATKFAMCE